MPIAQCEWESVLTSTGSTSINDCVCKQNYELDALTQQCTPCSDKKDNSFYNAIGGPKCRACFKYEYFKQEAVVVNGVPTTTYACRNLSRMELSFEYPKFSIENHDYWRPFTSGDIDERKPCLLSTASCYGTESGVTFYLHHELSRPENGQWKGGCQRAINIAQTNYECRLCNKWGQIGDDYYLYLGCGDTESDKRWHPEGNTNDQNKLEEITENNDAKNIYKALNKSIPYCAPGWYVDTNATGCPLKNQDQTTAWNTECCRKCGSAFEAQMKRAANFKPCTGATTTDTEKYTNRCEDGYYTSQSNGQQECRRCTTC